MTLKEWYQATGGDYEGTLRRLESEERMVRYLHRFASDGTQEALSSALAEGRMQEAFQAAHTLKGIALSLGLSRLSAQSEAMTEVLRAGRFPEPDEARRLAQECAALRESIAQL